MSKFKKKLTISIVAVVFALAAVVGAVVAIFAQDNITMTTDVSINYECSVAVQGSAKYWRGNASKDAANDDAAKTIYYKRNENGQLLNASDAVTTNVDEAVPMLNTLSNLETFSTQNNTLRTENISLTEKKPYVVFEYAFRSEDVVNNTATLSYTAAEGDENYAISWTTSATEVSIADEKSLTYSTPSTNADVISGDALTIDAGETVYVYVKVAIADVSKDAAFKGSFNWTINNVE